MEGYWLNQNTFFFVTQRTEPSLNRVVRTPSIANSETRDTREILSVKNLQKLLSEHSETPVDLDALAHAQFDMPDADTLAVSLDGSDYFIDWKYFGVRQVRPALHSPALYSSDGRWACFTKAANIWLRDRHTLCERALTTDGNAQNYYGLPPGHDLCTMFDPVDTQPMGLWSPNSRWFLTHRIDSSGVPEASLVQHAPTVGGRPLLHKYQYPLAGDRLPQATYIAWDVTTGRAVSFDGVVTPVSAFSPFFLRMVWFGTDEKAWLLSFDRYFKRADLIRLDLSRGTAHTLITETAPTGYLDSHPIATGTPNVRTLTQSDEVIWFSERDGWGHLYLYDASTGALKGRITRGNWLVRDIVHVDEKTRRLLLLAGGLDPGSDPAQRALCSVNLDGSDFRVLLTHVGDVFVPKTEPCGLGQERPFRNSFAHPGVSPSGRFAVVRYSSIERGNTTEIVDLQTLDGFALAKVRPPAFHVRTRNIVAKSADESSELHGAMFFPSDFNKDLKYPLIDYIYPGPQIPHKPQSFGSVVFSQAQALAELGFISIALNTRGTPVGSRAFRQCGYGNLLEPQLADHAAVIRQLCDRYPFIDRKRVGMVGESAGGAATVRALCDYSDIYSVGVAICGNHDSSLLLSSWSDKYRGPGTSGAWAGQANQAVAFKLKGKLLLISGDMDENVHVSHTISLVDALVRANRNFDLLIIPNARHQVLMSSGYAQRRTWDYLVTHLLGAVPPEGFKLEYTPHDTERAAQQFFKEVRE